MPLIANLATVERVLVTVVTPRKTLIPSWAEETTFVPDSNEKRPDCRIHEMSRATLAGLFPYLQEQFVVCRGLYQLNDPQANINGKAHRLRTRLVRRAEGDTYPVDDLAPFFEHALVTLRLRVGNDGTWISMFCFGRMQNRRPKLGLYVQQNQLWQITGPPPES